MPESRHSSSVFVKHDYQIDAYLQKEMMHN
jgi:hypothetical protein